MPKILLTANDIGERLTVHTDDLDDTATYVSMLEQALDVGNVIAQPFPVPISFPKPDDILIHLDSKGDVVGVEADRADTTLTILSLLDAATFLITHQHNETTE